MHANAPGALAADLNNKNNNMGCLGYRAAALFHSANLALINFDLSSQHGALGIDHGTAQLVQHSPGRE